MKHCCLHVAYPVNHWSLYLTWYMDFLWKLNHFLSGKDVTRSMKAPRTITYSCCVWLLFDVGNKKTIFTTLLYHTFAMTKVHLLVYVLILALYMTKLI